MALNKRKVLDSARKFAQKGAKAKALKEYQLLLQADPRDAKLLLEVGDAYRRWGQSEDAIAQYGKVAQQYRQDGFDARAVAVATGKHTRADLAAHAPEFLFDDLRDVAAVIRALEA